jgi:RHS repeat-associated protein
MRLLLINFFLFASIVCSAQAIISGNFQVQPGSTEAYSVTWQNPNSGGLGVLWTVSNGTVVSSSPSGCTIQWDNIISGVGGIQVSDPFTTETGSVSVDIGDPIPLIWPFHQMADYSTFPGAIQISFNIIPSGTITYQWMEWNENQQMWLNISGATNDYFYPPAIFANTRYACGVDVNGTYYQLESQVNVSTLVGGFLQLNGVPNYNSVPSLSVTSATGGPCYTSNYVYEWEISYENGPWQHYAYGGMPTFPAVTSLISLRRKVTCSGESAYSNTIVINPNYIPVDYENLNYIREITVVKKGVISWQEADALPVGDKFQSTIYMDGLGRTIQTVGKAISLTPSNTWNDMVKHVEYDQAGRMPKDFLPYSTADNFGKFKANAGTAQASFIQNTFNDVVSYSLVNYDESPINRVVKQMLPGQNWTGSNVGVSSEISFNDQTENVRIWSLDYTANSLPTTPWAYVTGSLYKSTVIDENGNKVITYTDLGGNVILRKVQEDANPSIHHVGWVCTYYIYNDFNELRYIITPKAVDYLNGNGWTITQELVDGLCYVYDYDSRGRQIIKKQPQVEPSYVIYDTRNRPVLTQDGNLRATNDWVFSLFDDQNRLKATGVLTKIITGLQVLQAEVDGIQPGNTSLTISVGVPETIVVETPVVLCYGATVKVYNSVTEYDHYDYPGAKAFANVSGYFPGNTDPNIDPTVQSDRVRGFVTGEKVRVVGPNNQFNNILWLHSTSFYDEKGRGLQSSTDNIRNAVESFTNQYDHSGKLIASAGIHSNGIFSIISVTKNTYDKIGRLVEISKQYNNSNFKVIGRYSYNQLGQISKKILAPGYTGTGSTQMETLNYAYNIQGWLTGINRFYALATNTYAKWDYFFGMYLGYENADGLLSQAQHDGTITGTIWKTQGNNSPKRYDYSYDRLSRLTDANFLVKNIPSDAWSSNEDYSSSVSYADKNGNISNLVHKGMIAGLSASQTIDNLSYQYKMIPNLAGLLGNQLIKVTDNPGAPANNGLLGDFKDGSNATQDDYDYDDNGNLKKDDNKDIIVTYNFLNKPATVIVPGKTITYTYDATGQKLTKGVQPNGGNLLTTFYLGDFLYEDNDLQYILHEEGRIKVVTPLQYSSLSIDQERNGGQDAITLPDNKIGVFEYFIKDHLGNVRMVLTEEEEKEKYTATMDENLKNIEDPYFGAVEQDGSINTKVNELEVTRLATSNTPWTSNGSSDVAHLTATNPQKRIGPNMLLKVMAGDVLDAKVDYFYYNNNPTLGSTTPAQDIASSLTSVLMGNQTSAVGHTNYSNIGNLFSVNSDVQTFLNNHYISNPSNPNAPHAYLNVVFLDEQFNFIPYDFNASTEGTGSIRVEQSNTQSASLQLGRKAPKNGWVFIYLSNESNEDVYFDNLVVEHIHGRISEESHYYPFGLKVAGLSSKAMGKLKNEFGYQGAFAKEDQITEWIEFDLRMYDPQIGRWAAVDPNDQFASPFVGLGNNPVNHIDKDGGYSHNFGWTPGLIGAAVGAVAGTIAAIIIIKNNHNWSVLGKIGIGIALPILGSGFGYGLVESLAKFKTESRNESNNFFANFRAFYEGIFAKSDKEGQIVFYRHNREIAWAPNIKFTGFKSILPKWRFPLFTQQEGKPWLNTIKWIAATVPLPLPRFLWFPVNGVYVDWIYPIWFEYQLLRQVLRVPTFKRD